jgi:E3 Ubiquitin ligase
VTVCLALFSPINRITILSSIAIVGGLYFFFLGFQLLVRKRLLLAMPRSEVRDAAPGLVEIKGMATGPYTMPAPITGKPCFLYHVTAWRQDEGKKQEWEKVADETLHLPFYVDDSTGQLLIEPLGADLDLHQGFREEYTASLFSSTTLSKADDIPPRISIFLSRHDIVPAHRLRIEERLIKPEDTLFITGTLTENPGVQVRPFSPRDITPRDASTNEIRKVASSNNSLQQLSTPQVIRLQSGAAPTSTQEMSQQAKIAAALNRAGITRPEAWSAAGAPYQSIAVEENAPLTSDRRLEESRQSEGHDEDRPKPSGFNLTPPVVLMKGENDSTFVISFRSQKEIVNGLAWKSAAMICGGVAIALLGFYMLFVQVELL